MPYRDPKKDRDYKHEEALFLARGGRAIQTERQRARREYDKAGIDRTGKDIDHKKKLAAGGTSAPSNLRLRSSKANQSDNPHGKPFSKNKKT